MMWFVGTRYRTALTTLMSLGSLGYLSSACVRYLDFDRLPVLIVGSVLSIIIAVCILHLAERADKHYGER